MSRSGGRSSTPRAVIHKRILDVADSNPNASMEEIAESIAGASTDLVERVLEEYGDPNEETKNGSASTAGATATRPTPDTDVRADEDDPAGAERPELTRKQLATLRLIEERPDASQGELAAEFDVTRATISRWLNDIPGFAWARRREIAAELLEDEGWDATDRGGPGRGEGFDALYQRLDALERKIERLERDREVEPPGIDPELAHKVVYASMGSDRITEEEELRLLRDLMG